MYLIDERWEGDKKWKQVKALLLHREPCVVLIAKLYCDDHDQNEFHHKKIRKKALMNNHSHDQIMILKYFSSFIVFLSSPPIDNSLRWLSRNTFIYLLIFFCAVHRVCYQRRFLSRRIPPSASECSHCWYLPATF